MFELRIKLMSPLAAGSGAGRAGRVDREVVFTPMGLPEIPGKRLKGLWRDGWREIAPAMDANVEEALFGYPGRREPGALRVGTGRLPDAMPLKSWLSTMLARNKKLTPAFTREHVLGLHTEVRRQTRISRRTGAAQDDTLRATRVLRAGLEFSAPVGAVASAYVEPLALAAAAIQWMGGSRTRGLGAVQCELWEGSINHTAIALGKQKPGAAAPVPKVSEEDEIKPDALGFELKTQHTASLRYRLTLEEPLVAPTLESDANTVVSFDYIPGSVIRGALGTAAIENGYLPGNDAFRELFLGGTAFGPAVPAPDPEGPAYVRVPLSVRTEKRDDRKVHDLASLPEEMNEPLRRVEGWCDPEDLEAGHVSNFTVRSEISYHHQRAHDRRIGKAVGELHRRWKLDPGEAGALYVYQAIAPGQDFEGEVRGTPEALAQIRKLVPEGTRLNLGRSRSAGYGGAAALVWAGKDADPATPGFHGWVDTIRVTLQSPLLTMNDQGHPSPEFPQAELEEALGCSLTESFASARRIWQGGYLSHLLAARQQMPALQEGSVYHFQLSQPLSAGKLQEAEQRAYGMRTEDGFGLLTIRPVPPVDLPWSISRENGSGGPAHGIRRVTKGSPAYRLAQKLFRAVLIEKAADEARLQAEAIAKGPKPLDALSPSLIARLHEMAEHLPMQELPKGLGLLRETAKRKLERYVVPNSKQPKEKLYLHEHLRDVAVEPISHAASWAKSLLKAGNGSWNEVFGQDDEVVTSEAAEKAARVYLGTLLNELQLYKRKDAKPAAQSAGGTNR